MPRAASARVGALRRPAASPGLACTARLFEQSSHSSSLFRDGSQGALGLTNALLEVGADKNALGADAVPLVVIAAEVSAGVTLALVCASADLSQSDASGRTALEVAVSRGEDELCEVLLAKGARPTSRKDASGNTSLHLAVERRAETLVRLLIMHKAELSEQNRKGQTVADSPTTHAAASRTRWSHAP